MCNTKLYNTKSPSSGFSGGNRTSITFRIAKLRCFRCWGGSRSELPHHCLVRWSYECWYGSNSKNPRPQTDPWFCRVLSGHFGSLPFIGSYREAPAARFTCNVPPFAAAAVISTRRDTAAEYWASTVQRSLPT